MKWTDQNFNAVREALGILYDNGFCIANLYHISKVQEHNPNMTDEKAHDVLENALNNGYIKEIINETIEEYINDL